MKVKETFSKDLKRSYDVTVPVSTIEEKMNAKLVSIGKTAKVKGFREGKAPMDILKKQYGNAVKGEVLEQVVNESSQAALKQQKVTPAVPPKIEITEFKDGKDLVFSMQVELFPEVPQIDFAKIEIEKLEIEHSDSDIDDAVGRLVAQSKQLKTKSGAAKNGDSVKIDFEGFLGDKAFPGGKGTNFTLGLGSGQFIPGFEEQLEGAKAGENVTVNVTFPKEYHSADLAGKDARFEVKIHEVLENSEAELTDEFAKEFGVSGVAELKQKMREQLEADQKRFVRLRMKEKLFDHLNDNCKIDLPEAMTKVEFDMIWGQLQQQKAQGYPTDLDKKSEDEVKKDYQAVAERRVALGIILSTISKRDNVEIKQQDVVDAINEKAQQFPGQEDKVRDFYMKNPQAIRELTGPLLEEKVVDYILGKVKLKSKKTTMKELIALEQDDADESAKSTKGKKKSK